MNWLIIGGNFLNKGAQLMLEIVSENIMRASEENTICIAGMGDIKLNLNNNTKFHNLDFALPHIGSNWKFIPIVLFGSIFKKFKNKYQGDVPLSDIDVIIDISGYAYGDPWGFQPVLNLYILLAFVIKNRVKIIFFPQTFGPFANKYSKKLVKKIIERANLIFARDVYSYNQLIAIQKIEKIKIVPDITISSIFHSHKETQIFQDKFVVLIPNARMIDKGDDDWKQNYAGIMSLIIDKLFENNLIVHLLIHDKGGEDKIIAKDIARKANNNVEIMFFENPVEIKDYLGRAFFVIGSRYHGLVSALSSNVPAIGLGWSSKYEMLFNDYALKNYVFSSYSKINEIKKCIENLVVVEENLKIRKQLLLKNTELIERVKEMWTEVYNCVK